MNQTDWESCEVPVLPATGLPTASPTAGAALDHAFQHRDNLIGGARVDDLRPGVGEQRLLLVMPGGVVAAVAVADVVAPDGPAVAVLDAVDQRG